MLTVFIDALSHKVASDIFLTEPSLLLERKPQRLRAGAGYSSNLHWELFAGRTADDLGFFCDWGLKSGWRLGAPGNIKHRLLSRTDGNSLFNTAIRVVLRKLGRRDDNILWSERRYFDHSGSYLFSSESSDAREHRARLGVIESGDYISTFISTDKAISEGQKNIVAVVNELDSLGHQVGGSAPEYSTLARKILDRAKHSISLYRATFPDEKVRMLSDHGMHDVKFSVDPLPALHRHLGYPGEDYLIYTDSVYLRAWFLNDRVGRRFIEVVASLNFMRILTTLEREQLGITSPEFGEVICALNDGVVFNPNMFSLWVRGGPAGMHGYLSDSAWSCGFYVADGPGSGKTEITPKEVASFNYAQK